MPGSYLSRWRVRRIDPELWLPFEEVDGVDSLAVARSVNDGNAPLLESGEMEVSGLIDEGYYRVEMLVESRPVVNVATLLFAPDGPTWSHGSWSGPVAGRSVLAPAAERYFKPGEYAPKGIDAPAWCASLLRRSISAPVVVQGTYRLSDHVVFDSTVSHIAGIWKVLDAVGMCIRISGAGVVSIVALPSDPDLVVGARKLDIICPGIKQGLPIEGVPNKVIVYDGDGDPAIAVNDDPSSPTSTVKRRRVIEHVEVDPTRREGETAQQYADRRLAELSDVYETHDVNRGFVEGVDPYSIVRANMSEPGVTGDFRVLSQSLRCGRGILVGETWGRRP